MSLLNIYFEKCNIDLRKGANVLLNSWNNIDLTHVKEVGYKSQYQAAPLHRPQRTKSLTLASTKLLVQGVIMARIDYCNVLLYGVPAVHLSIEIATSSEFRSVLLITHTPRYCRISSAACTALVTGEVPNFILHDPTAKFKCTLGVRSFTAAAPRIWNGLPDYIRKENDFDKFIRDSLRRTIFKRSI